MLRVKTPNNTNIASYLEPDTEYKVLNVHENGSFDFDLKSHGYDVNGYSRQKDSSHLNGQDWIIINDLPNRQFLADFLKLNNIKKTLVSKYLGYSQNWLTQMANDKRRDMTDATMQSILKKLHIDWTQDTFIHVKATKEHTAYRTRPCTYEHDKHKEMLQRAMWDGLFVKA